MPQPNDLSRSLVALDHNSTIIAVVEMSQSSWWLAVCFPALSVSRARSWSRAPSGCFDQHIGDQLLRAGPRMSELAPARAERDRGFAKTDIAYRGHLTCFC